MPVVPFDRRQSEAPPQRPAPDEPWMLMALAQMHADQAKPKPKDAAK